MTNWNKKWEDGDIGFHQTNIHPQLKKNNKFSKGTILVPLCGKSLDMVYLASQGHFVVGVELSSIACGDFFKENRIPFSIKTVNDFTVYESKNISIWCGDFFKLPNSVWEKCCGSYDRAAYIALPSEARMKYAEEFRKKGKHNFEIFLVTVEYPKGTLQGPPFSIQEEEITKNFKDFCIEKLSTAPWKVGENTFEEAVYWLKR